MKTDDKNKIGKLIEGPAYRDAVHVAVAPCVAGEHLEPGAHVAFMEDGTVNAWHSNKIGVVDPFLTDTVKKGDRFWVLLYPGTALNLRHEWDHPAFRKPETSVPPSGTEGPRMWLQVYAEQHGLKLEDMLAAVEQYIAKGCDDPVLEDDFKDYETPDAFWVYYHALTGRAGKGNFWGCCI